MFRCLLLDMYLIRWTKCGATMGVNISYTRGGYISDIMGNNDNLPHSTKGCMYYRVLLFDIQFYAEKPNMGLKHKWRDHDLTNKMTICMVENAMRSFIFEHWISLRLSLSLNKSVDSGMLVMELGESNIILCMRIGYISLYSYLMPFTKTKRNKWQG